jgi:hypothetical protein
MAITPVHSDVLRSRHDRLDLIRCIVTRATVAPSARRREISALETHRTVLALDRGSLPRLRALQKQVADLTARLDELERRTSPGTKATPLAMVG